MGIGCAEDFVTSKLSSDKLADDVSVGESDDKTVFGSIVLVLGLRNQALAGIVISLACSSALVLGLEAAGEKSQLATGRKRYSTYLKYALFLTSLVKGIVTVSHKTVNS